MADDDAIKRELNAKLKLLIQRERDVHTLLRKVNITNKWLEISAQLANSVASSNDPASALDALADALAEQLGYEFAVATWGQLLASRPRDVAPAVAKQLQRAVAQPHTSQVHYETRSEGDVRELLRLEILSKVAPGDRIVAVVARTERTAMYEPTLDAQGQRRMQFFVDSLGNAFDAVRLRVALTHERDTLKAKVAAATVDLRQAVADAEQARLQAERFASARGEFLANMSHEIRTPLTAILGYTDLLQAPALPEADRTHYLDVVARSGRHLLQLLDDILDLARIESGRLGIEAQVASLPAMLFEIQSLLSVRAHEKGILLELHFTTPLPTRAEFALHRLRQIVINLVGNAIKFTERGTVRLSAALDAGVFRLTVVDSGIGIAADKLDTIFEAFEQVHNSANRVRGGAGLGLAISRRLAHLMQGELTATSELGVGSRFEVNIPVVVQPDTDYVTNTKAVAPLAAPSQARAKLRGRVLIVEDTPVNLALFREILSNAGLAVDTAVDGSIGIDKVRNAAARNTRYDVVLLDMQMPVLDGYQAAQILRAEFPSLPIIALTAHAMAGDREACLAAGCSGYLAKPLQQTELFTLLESFLPKRGDGDQPDLVSTFHTDQVIRSLLGEFIVDTQQMAGQLANMVATNDRPALAAAAHRIRGAAATFGFPLLADQAAQLEQAANDPRAVTDELRRQALRILATTDRLTV